MALAQPPLIVYFIEIHIYNQNFQNYWGETKCSQVDLGVNLKHI